MTPTASAGSFNKGEVRTSKTDGVKINVTGDKTRDKCIEIIYDALASDSGARASRTSTSASLYTHVVLPRSERADHVAREGNRGERAFRIRRDDRRVQEQAPLVLRQPQGQEQPEPSRERRQRRPPRRKVLQDVECGQCALVLSGRRYPP